MGPYRTVEARWFMRGEVPAAVRAWFDALGPPVETERRSDHYLAPASAGLGVKVRQGRVEAKRADRSVGRIEIGRAQAPTVAWAKWLFPLAGAVGWLGPEWIVVHKARQQRRTETCSLELGQVSVGDDVWWSVCLEAVGPTLDAREAALLGASRQWLGQGDAPDLPETASMGYPAWLLARETHGPKR